MYEMNRTANRMTTLLNKIERRLGAAILPLPKNVGKSMWHEIIEEDTLPTFSRFFPLGITTIIDNTCMKDGYYFVDKDLPDGAKIIGVQDVDWEAYRVSSEFDRYAVNFDSLNFVARDYSLEDVAFQQVGTDLMSLFNLGIYPEFIAPNKVKLVSVSGSTVSKYMSFPLKVLLEHPANLMTISPTMMETFERLAQADIATMLYQNLKFYDGFDTTYAQLDLHLDTIQEWYNKREDIIRELDEAHTTTANEAQPAIITV